MNKRSVAASVAIVSVFLGILAWLYRAGRIGLVAIAVIVLTGFVFVAASHYFYKRLWLDDES